MYPAFPSRFLGRKGQGASFTLVELLVVMFIIALLAGLILEAGSGLMQKAKRNRAAGEVQAISSALESYKVDNGIYPTNGILVGGTNGTYAIDPSTNGGTYQQGSQLLYEALAGKTNYNDSASAKSYLPFKLYQLGNYTTAAGTAYSATTATYIKDPWNYSYGYSTGDGTAANVPLSGTNFFDLWSTGGLIANPSATAYATNAWISNWNPH